MHADEHWMAVEIRRLQDALVECDRQRQEAVKAAGTLEKLLDRAQGRWWKWVS